MSSAKAILAACAALVLAGCGSHITPQYHLYAGSMQEVKVLKTATAKPIALGEFTSAQPGRDSIDCRAAGAVRTTEGKPFEAYMRDALAAELASVDLFSPDAPVVLKGRLEEFDFNSNSATWKIRMTFSAPTVESFAVEHTHLFASSFLADIACRNVAQALRPATQGFFRQLFSHPSFRKLLAPG